MPPNAVNTFLNAIDGGWWDGEKGGGECPHCGTPDALQITIDERNRITPSCKFGCSAPDIVRARQQKERLRAYINGREPSQASKLTKITEADIWDAPLPLYGASLPPFPLSALPSWVADMVEATATATQTPVDLPGMFALSVLATALQKRMEAQVREGWQEPLSLWTVTALPPGNRKSPAYTPLVGAITEYETELVGLMEAEIAAAVTEKEIAEGALKRAKDQAIRAKTEFERQDLTREAKRLAADLEKMRVPKSPRLVVDDATPERLGMLLSDHGGRMAILSPEGDVFDMMAGKYSNGTANIGLYLRGHSGDDVIVDRVGRPAIVVRRAAITMGLMVQPEVLLGLTANSAFRGRGLLARFLYSVPASMVGRRKVRATPISREVANLYTARLGNCLRYSCDTDEEGRPVPHLVRFGEEADDAVADFEQWIEPQLAPGAEFGFMADWAGKLSGQMVRIATLLHVATLAEMPNPWSLFVDGETVGSSRKLAEYLIPHAKAAFAAMGTDPAINGARIVLDWIKEHGVDRFSQRDAFNGLRASFSRSKDLVEPLAVLGEHGYIRQIAQPKRDGPGQPPSPEFVVHPSLRID